MSALPPGRCRRGESVAPPVSAIAAHAPSAQSRGCCSLTFEPAQRTCRSPPFCRQADAVGGHPTQTIICAVYPRSHHAPASIYARAIRLALHPDTITADKDPLVRLSGPVLPRIVEDGRGHCEKIELIRVQYLDGWLDPLRRNHEAAVADIKRIFASLEKADGELFDKLVATASSMQDIARDALKKLLAQDKQGAIEEFRRAVPPLIDLRVALQDAQIELIRVKNAFIRGMGPGGTATPWRERFASLLRRGIKPELPA
jgi:hypothetical protein